MSLNCGAKRQDECELSMRAYWDVVCGLLVVVLKVKPWSSTTAWLSGVIHRHGWVHHRLISSSTEQRSKGEPAVLWDPRQAPLLQAWDWHGSLRGIVWFGGGARVARRSRLAWSHREFNMRGWYWWYILGNLGVSENEVLCYQRKK